MSVNPRDSKTINNQTTYFIYDGYKLIGEYNQDGEPIKEYLYLNNTPIAIITPTNIYKIYSDHLNTPRQVATNDSTSTIIWSWESKPFGESKANEDVDGDGNIFTLNLRFPGQYFDKETKKHYNINRDYDPITGRYIQSDPIGFEGGVNTYLYANGNSLRFVDELGLAVGHHYVPKAVFKKLIFSNEAKEFFDKATTGGPIPGGHKWDMAHREYNKAVEEALVKWLKEKNINPYTMTKEEAGQFLKHLSNTNDPRIINFIKSIEKKAGTKLIKKGVGFAVKKLPLINVGIFAYVWYQEGFMKAVDDALWPASELWN